MDNPSKVARFVNAQIEATGQSQKDIAAQAGFAKPNMITMIKQGRTRLPLDKVGPMAKALKTDPVQLLAMCMKEYHPATWKAIAPYLELAITEDERKLLSALRAWVGGSFNSALNEESRSHFENFHPSLRFPVMPEEARCKT
jgi:hypothetical protein